MRRWIPAGVIALALLLSILAYPQLPDTVAVHWGAAGKPDRWLDRAWAALLLPSVMLVNWLLLLPLIRRVRVPGGIRPGWLPDVIVIGSTLVLFALHLLVLGTALADAPPVADAKAAVAASP